MKKGPLRTFLMGLMVGVLIYALVGLIRAWSEMETEKRMHQSLLEKVEHLSKLQLVKYRIKDIMVLEKGRVPMLTRSKALLVASGEAYGCVDLSKVKDRIEIRGDTVLVRLPQPEVCTYKLDHSRTHLYDLDMSLLDIATDRQGEFMDRLYREAEERILQEALRGGILEDTRKQAVNFLRDLITSMGFRIVVFQWEGQ